MFHGFEDLTGTFTVIDVVLAIGLSFVLSVSIAFVYRATHRGVSYSQSFAQTLVLLGMIVALVMLIVGSNLARAFTLGGALSIIRFRNAVKETRDVGFIFLVMVVGMAAGTRFYSLAVISTVAIGGAIYLMTRLDWFALDVRSQVVRVQLPIDDDPEILEDTLVRLTSRSELISAETIAAGTLAELLFSIQLKRSTTPNDLVRALLERNGGHKVSILTGYDRSDL
jgi:hypothetical protein